MSYIRSRRGRFRGWQNRPEWPPDRVYLMTQKVTVRPNKRVQMRYRLQIVCRMRFLEDRSIASIARQLGVCRRTIQRDLREVLWIVQVLMGRRFHRTAEKIERFPLLSREQQEYFMLVEIPAILRMLGKLFGST